MSIMRVRPPLRLRLTLYEGNKKQKSKKSKQTKKVEADEGKKEPKASNKRKNNDECPLPKKNDGSNMDIKTFFMKKAEGGA